MMLMSRPHGAGEGFYVAGGANNPFHPSNRDGYYRGAKP